MSGVECWNLLVGSLSLSPSPSPSYEYLMHREGRTEDGVWGVGCAAAEIIVVQTNIPEKCKEQGLIRLGGWINRASEKLWIG